MSDDAAVLQYSMYTQAKVLAPKCSEGVKLVLFTSYCTSLYTTHLWARYKKSEPTETTSGQSCQSQHLSGSDRKPNLQLQVHV